MPELSNSGIYGLPTMTLDSLQHGGDARVLGWIREAIQEGDWINRSDPAYDNMAKGMAYVSGLPNPTGAGGSGGPAYLPSLQFNESRRVIQAHTSALTDLQPVFAYKATNPAFNTQADLLNKLTLAWWLTEDVDIELGNCVKYSLAAGTGDLVSTWDPYAGWGGDIRVDARDARDTLAIRPATHDRGVQAWQGLILREGHSVNAMRGDFPLLADKFRPTTDSLISTLMGGFRRLVSKFQSPAGDTLGGLSQPAVSSKVRTGDIILYRVWLTDKTRNLTAKPIPMGDPSAAWSYIVPPGGFLYPYKRMILATPEFLIYDGPNTYWHGEYPVSRLKLWSLPWNFLGLSLLNDLMPLQDGINQTMQSALLGINKWLDPAVQYNRGAVSESFMRIFDPRRPGNKIKLNQDGMREGFKVLDGPNPQVLQLAFEVAQQLQAKFADLSGTPNLQELLQLRQSPAAETIQKYWEALTPELRQEGRMVEAFLRGMAEQVKSIRFQFESNARRVTILGDAGETLQDFDFDPAHLVPSMVETDPNYQPAFDAKKPRDQRAQAMNKTIIFTLAPNSLLNINATEKKMMNFQLARMGMMDIWTLADSLDIPNMGTPPPMPLPPLNPEEASQEFQALAQAALQGDQQAAATLRAKYVLDPMTGTLLQIRPPMTIIERLMAQNQLGVGVAENSAGRKAGSAVPPHTETKGDGRQIVSESK